MNIINEIINALKRPQVWWLITVTAIALAGLYAGGMKTTQLLAGVNSPETGVLIGIAVGVFFMSRYLSRPSAQEVIDTEVGLPEHFRETLLHLQAEVEELTSLSRLNRAITEADRKDLIDQIKSSLRADASRSYLTELETEIRGRLEIEDANKTLKAHFERTSRRLHEEIEALTRRGNLNLVLGTVTAALGIAVLASYVLAGQTEGSPLIGGFLDHRFLSRLSLAIVIEIFAYFFLRLYSTSLGEIKYFQNEITNIESKQLALTVAMQSADDDLTKDVVRELASTERNFVLSQGQTTATIERARLESGAVDRISKTMLDLASKQKT